MNPKLYKVILITFGVVALSFSVGCEKKGDSGTSSTEQSAPYVSTTGSRRDGYSTRAQSAPPSPVSSGSTKVLTISAAPWQSTGITVTSRTKLVIEASGQWTGDGKNGYGPDGTGGSAPNIFLAPGLPAGGLVGRVGPNVFFVGSHRSLDGANCGTGSLELAMNDERSGYGDNTGNIEVRISVIE